jgi:hypothetical protein
MKDMQIVGRRKIGAVWYIAEVDTNPDHEDRYHWHIKKLPVKDGRVILGNLTVFGIEMGSEGAKRKALAALEDEARYSESAVD